MEKETISITRGLAELKLLDKRIYDKINSLVALDLEQNKSVVTINLKKDKEQFKSETKDSFKSLEDLIKRFVKIKDAIFASNYENKVKIGGKTYTVVEAIDTKKTILYKEKLLNSLKVQYARAIETVELNKNTLETQINKMLEQALGSGKKYSKEDYDNIAKPFIDANEVKIIDPVNISKYIESLESEIENFKSEVDFVLSEANSKNTIEI